MNATRTSVLAGLPRRDWIGLALFAGGCLLVGAIGGIATASSVGNWYAGLAKPSWNPPDPVFAPVWTLLYVMMGVAAWMVWRHRGRNNIRAAMVMFGVQLALNTAWSMLFFGLRQPGLAVVDIVLLWLCIVATIGTFVRVSRAAAWLLVPYLGWVSFAAALNLAIWRLNV